MMRRHRLLLLLELEGQRIRFDSLGPWAAEEGEAKAIKLQGPLSLAEIQPFGCVDMLQIFRICPNHKGKICRLEPVSL